MGIFIDGELRLDTSALHCISKLKKGLSALCRNKFMFPLDAKLNLYYAFVHPHIQLISLYINQIKPLYINIIVKLQKRAIRAIKSLSFYSHTAEHFFELDIMPLHILSQFNIFKFMYDIVSNNKLEQFSNLWKLRSDSFGFTGRLLRNSHHLTVPKIVLKIV